MAIYGIIEINTGKIIAWSTDQECAESQALHDPRDAVVQYFPNYTEQDIQFKKWVDGELVLDQEEFDEAVAWDVRCDRNYLLLVVDEIAGNTLRWNSLTSEKQQEWAQYRQDLLDVPQQTGFPHDVNWPVKPE